MKRGKRPNSILTGSNIMRRRDVEPGKRDKWDPRYIRMVYEIALLGASNPEIAAILDVGTSTLDNWRKRYPEFEIAILKGKERADAKVAKALYSRATGYSHPDVHLSNYQGKVTITPIIKYYPPDTAAVKFWLTNRQPEKWIDMGKVENSSQHLHLHQGLNLSDISTEELEIMEKVGMKKLLSDHKRKN